MTTEFKIDGELIPKGLLQTFSSEIEKAFAIELSDEVVRIIQRTQKGQDKNDNTFKPLSKSYAAFKANGGRVNQKRVVNNAGKVKEPARRPISSQTNPTNLTFTGQMLQALTSSVEKISGGFLGKIGFLSAKESDKAIGNIKYGRDFFGLTKDFESKVTSRIQQIWSK